MLTNRHIRIGIALLVSMGLHSALIISSVELQLPGKIFQQQKKSVTMTLASRPVQRTHVPASKEKQHSKPVVKKIIKEIPAPQLSNPEKTINLEEKLLLENFKALTDPDQSEPTEKENSLDSNSSAGKENFIKAKPLYKDNPPPNYPSTARRRGYQGTVILEVMVTESGSVRSVNVFESSGYKVLDKAAIKAVKGWGFSPATRLGQPMEMWVKIPVQFILL